MMTAAFGDEAGSSMSLLQPDAIVSQVSVDGVGGSARGAAQLLDDEEYRDQQRGQEDVPGPQLMEDRWPSGEEAPLIPGGGGSGGVGTLDIGERQTTQLVMPPRIAEHPPADPFAMQRPPIVNGGGGSAAASVVVEAAAAATLEGKGSIGSEEIRAQPPAIVSRPGREWNLRTTKPTPSYSYSAVGTIASSPSGSAADNGRKRMAGVGVRVAREAGGVGATGALGANLTPPKWLPDEKTTACTGCGKEFDWARRRHHCRLCGAIFCWACSQFRALLPRSFGSRDPQRLCQPCNARVAPLQEMLAESMSNAVKENDVEKGTLTSYLNRPISFTLGAEVRKAAYTIHNFTKEGMIQDQSIPQELLSRAKGLAFLTVLKGGFIVAGRMGTGLVVAKTPEGVWSAPSAIATIGMGWGVLVGGEITDFVLVLNTDAALEAFSGRGQVSIGAELSVAVGPVGRTGAGNVSVAAEGVAHAYSYSHSRGLFAGLSLEGGVIVSRPDVDRKFYGRQVSVRDLLSGNVAPPPAARPLYEALENRGSSTDQQRLLSQGFRVG